MAVTPSNPQHAGQSAQSFLTQGNNAMRNGDYRLALSLFQQALQQTPALAKVIEFNIGLLKKKIEVNQRFTPVEESTVAKDIDITSSTGIKHTPVCIPVKIVSVYEGRLEKNDNGLFRGWAINKSKKNEIFELSVQINGVHFCKVKNHDNRADLVKAGKSTGKGGYSFVIPSAVLDENENTIKILYPDGCELSSVVLPKLNKFQENDIILLPVEEKVSVIVPIYNAVDDVKVCIERLVKYTAKDVDIILINDASPDQNIKTLLTDAQKHTNMRVFHNEENLGFTKTVNRGIELAGSNDVILLNSDARVTPRWIEGFRRALATDHKIATVTAMSDRAGAFSAPNIGNENDLPMGVEEEEYAVAFRRRGVGYYPTVPTGNGFCMYIRRRCIDEIGSLDSEAFPRGYGEENDFCMRARAAGWRNVIDDRTYVFHDRSKSFGSEKDVLIKAGRAVIDERYLDYSRSIQIFSKSPLIHVARFKARIALADCSNVIKPRVLYVISTLTGGTPQTNRDLMLSLTSSIEPWLLRCDSREMFLYRVFASGDIIQEHHVLKNAVDPLTHTSEEYDRVIFNWLSRYDFEIVHIRHIAWHSLNLFKISKIVGAKVVKSFHDFYTLCPTVKLIDGDGFYCHGNCTTGEKNCIPELWEPDSLPKLKNNWVKFWRDKFSKALHFCDFFVTTSVSAKETITKNLSLNPLITFDVIPHGRDFTRFRKPHLNIPLEKIKILVPGNIDLAKGLNVIIELLEIDTSRKLEFHILGRSSLGFKDKRVVEHGVYNRDDFITIVDNINPTIGVVFSVWDETWCHTLTELWAAGLPSVVFNYPTVSMRVNESGAGWVVDNNAQSLYDFFTGLLGPASSIFEKMEKLEQWQKKLGLANSISLMSAQYFNLYKGKTGALLKDIVAVVCPSDPMQIKAPGSTHVRVWQKTRNNLDRYNTYLRVKYDVLISLVDSNYINKGIIQRTALSESEWARLNERVLDGSFEYIFDIDDDLLSVPQDKDNDNVYLNYRETLTKIVTNANLVLVSNDILRVKYSSINSNTLIEKNYLSKALWRLQDRTNKEINSKFCGLYFGSYTHEEDLEIVMPSMRKLAEKFPNFRLKVVGVTRSRSFVENWIQFINVPADKTDYESFVPWLKEVSKSCSFGIAPLKENEFNNYKSDLKIKELLALNLDVFASNFGPYKNFNHDCVSLVDNNSNAWFNAIFNYMTSIEISKNSEKSSFSDFFVNDLAFDQYFNHLS